MNKTKVRVTFMFVYVYIKYVLYDMYKHRCPGGKGGCPGQE